MSTRDLAKIVIPIAVGLIIIVIIVVAVYFPPYGTLECELSSAPGDPHAEYVYKFSFSNWKVNNLVTELNITTKNKELLEMYKKSEEEIINSNKSLDYYERKIKLSKNSITSTTTINYKKMKNKPMRIGKLKKMYQETGATCKYK